MEMVVIFASAIVMEALGLGLAIGYMAAKKGAWDERYDTSSPHKRQFDSKSETG